MTAARASQLPGSVPDGRPATRRSTLLIHNHSHLMNSQTPSNSTPQPSPAAFFRRPLHILALSAALSIPHSASAATYAIQTIGSPSLTGGFALALNNAGEVASTSLVRSFTYSDNSFTSSREIIIPNAATSNPGVVAQGINDLGEVVGRFRTNGNPLNQTSGFILRTNGTLDVFNAPSVASTSISMLNDSGDIVGETRSDLTPFGLIRGFVFKAGTFTEIHMPGADLTRAYGINDSGTIVGHFQNSDAVSRPFVLNAGTFTELSLPNAPGGSASAIAFSISDNGSILGTYRDSTSVTRTWVRLPDGSYQYPDLPGSGRAINDAGQITGSYLDPANANIRTAYLATPIPEPASILLMATSAAVLLRRNRRSPV